MENYLKLVFLLVPHTFGFQLRHLISFYMYVSNLFLKKGFSKSYLSIKTVIVGLHQLQYCGQMPQPEINTIFIKICLVLKINAFLFLIKCSLNNRFHCFSIENHG